MLPAADLIDLYNLNCGGFGVTYAFYGVVFFFGFKLGFLWKLVSKPFGVKEK